MNIVAAVNWCVRLADLQTSVFTPYVVCVSSIISSLLQLKSHIRGQDNVGGKVVLPQKVW